MNVIQRLLVFAQFIQAQIKKNIKAARHWPLWGEFIGHRPVTRKMFPFDGVNIEC